MTEQYKKQFNKRRLLQIQRFREFGILTETELEMINNKEAWLLEYMTKHHYLTVNKLAGDFMLEAWTINLLGQGGGNPLSEMKRILAYQFLPLIRKFVLEGKLKKHNTRTYKVVKK